MTALWTPRKRDGNAPLRVDASAAFGHPVVSHTTARQLHRLVRQLRADPDRVRVSNEKFRKCLSFDVDAHSEDERNVYCGDVLVFYCARYVIDGRGIPILAE